MIGRSRQHGQIARPLDGLSQAALVLSTYARAAPGHYLAAVRNETLQKGCILVIDRSFIRTKHTYLGLYYKFTSPFPSLNCVGFH